MWNLISLAALFLAGLALYRYGGPILRRFDERNAARQAEEFRAQFDALAHYRQTMRVADEQVEDVIKVTAADARTGQPVTRYIFLGTEYATRGEAEAARQSAIVDKARAFYLELDTLWLQGRRAYRDQTPTALPAPNTEKR